jgi:hypothetical protein
MTFPRHLHPSADDLQAYADGKLDGPPAEAICDHLADCQRCAQYLADRPRQTVIFLEAAGPANPGSAEAGVAGLPAVPGYEILQELGRGGMGVVYRARQRGLSRSVALKMILRGEYAGPEERARFRAEAEAIARLHHPNIVQIFEVAEHHGQPFFVLEFCPGGSLANKLAGTPLPPREAAALLEPLARAVEAAHRQQVIHRDLKPANVLLAQDGEPKVTDFGLAKMLDPGGDAPTLAARSAGAGITASGAILGTPSYMAPEQASGKSRAIGPPADVYALGAILYECLTGRPPFRGPTQVDTILQVLSQQPVPPSRLQPAVPRDLETICLKCLQKEPSRRYPGAEALAEDLRRFRAGEPIRARRVSAAERVWKWARRRPAAAALVLLLLFILGAGGAYLIRQGLDRHALGTEMDRALAEAEATRDEFDKRLVMPDAAKPGISILEVTVGDTGTDNAPWVKDLTAAVDGWRTRLAAALEKVETANALAAANPQLVEPALAVRLKALRDQLHADEATLRAVEKRAKNGAARTGNGFPHDLAVDLLGLGDALLLKEKEGNPQLALGCYETAARLLRGCPPSFDIHKEVTRRREAASFLAQGPSRAMTQFPTETYRGELHVQEVRRDSDLFGGLPIVEKSRDDAALRKPGVVAAWQEKPVWLTWTVPPAVHDLELRAGRVYFIDLESAHFAGRHSVKDSDGKWLASSWGSQLTFSPKKDGLYHVQVSSFSDSNPRRRPAAGPYTLTVQALARGN